MTIYGLKADVDANPGKSVQLFVPGRTQLNPGDVFLGGPGTGVTDEQIGPATRVYGNTAQDTANALDDWKSNLASQMRRAMVTNNAPRPDASMGTPTVARQLMEMRQAQAKIDNSINDSGLTGSYNNAPTLAQKKFDHQVSQDAFTNKLNVGDLMGIYEGLPTLTKQALAIKDAQFKAKLAQSQQQFNSSLAAQTAADRSENSGIPSRPTNVSGNVASWLQQALEATGQSADMLPYLATIVQHESGGNPTAVNDWDSNAKAGHPSKGLMQTIDSTFNTYAMPGHGDIWNPVDNAIAAIRYAVSRYGSLENVPGIQSLARGGKYIGY